MSEDDTFLRLKRLPYSDVAELYIKWIHRTGLKASHQDILPELNNFFRQYGWTWEEYMMFGIQYTRT